MSPARMLARHSEPGKHDSSGKESVCPRRTLRFVAITCATLVLGLTLTHVLEALGKPGKAQLSGSFRG